MKSFMLARGLMVALVVAGGLSGSAPLWAQTVPEGMKQYMPDVDNFQRFTQERSAAIQAQAVKDVDALKKAKSDHADEAQEMLNKTMSTSTDSNSETAKGMEQYMPSEASFKQATKTTVTSIGVSELMKQGSSCMSYSWTPVVALQNVCCYNFMPCPKSHGKYLDSCKQTKCWNNKKGSAFDITYWEPSEVIEVSCRSDFSLLKPSGVGTRGGKALQSCTGFNKPGNHRYFFEARVWAINGYDGKLRHKSALGAVNGERMRQCSEFSDPGDTTAKRYWGYGRTKEGTFSHPTSDGNGPEGSWEAYISDTDANWATDSGGGSYVKPAVCKAGETDIAKCWGTTNATGWVTHSDPRLAAATVAWRAHTKAVGLKKVSGPGKGGYQMMLEYPFVKYSGAAGGEMGLSGGSKTGSKCFKPGDSGPDWYGGYKAEAIPDKVSALTSPTLTSVAEVNSGIYIFTVWVKTTCRRWTVETKGPAGMCKYEDKS